ncbi:T9SS type A sorting domain-containing protein [Candidatus Latescibacterota bacterium]
MHKEYELIKREIIYGLLIIGFVFISVGFQKNAFSQPIIISNQSSPTTEFQATDATFKTLKKTNDGTIVGVLKDWLITPMDLVITGDEIYISSNLDNRIVVLDLNGKILRYYKIETNSKFDNVCVGVTSRGQVLALSSKGLWELKPDGEAIKLFSKRVNIGHMAIGPNDDIYISRTFQGQSKIVKMDLNGTTTDIVTIVSNRITDIDFDSNGNLFIFDDQNRQILKYSQQQGLETFSREYSEFGGFDTLGRLYTTSAGGGLALISEDGERTPLGLNGPSGDLVFHEDILYTLDIYTSTLYQIVVNKNTVLDAQILLEGTVPWYIDHQNEVIVGQRSTPFGQKFYNYYISDPIRVEPNQLLNELQPNQYTFDDAGNMYLLFQNVLKKITPEGKEEFAITLPGNFQWNTRIHHNPADGNIYYFDADFNSIISTGINGTKTYHKFSSEAENVFLTFTLTGKIYAAVIFRSPYYYSKIIDISNPPQEIKVWIPYRGLSWFHIASDTQGKLYATLGPVFQSLFFIDPSDGRAVSIFPQSPSHDNIGYVDTQGLTITESGIVAFSAPGILFGINNATSTSSTKEQFPIVFNLSQNYPNPFNFETSISYKVPELSNILITIYNILGQKIKTLIDEEKHPGSYSVKWNGTDDSGQKVTSGIYIYIMETDKDFIKLHKMMFLK